MSCYSNSGCKMPLVDDVDKKSTFHYISPKRKLLLMKLMHCFHCFCFSCNFQPGWQLNCQRTGWQRHVSSSPAIDPHLPGCLELRMWTRTRRLPTPIIIKIGRLSPRTSFGLVTIRRVTPVCNSQWQQSPGPPLRDGDQIWNLQIVRDKVRQVWQWIL